MASLTELFEFLDSPNPAARQVALSNLVGHSAKNDPQRDIFIPSSLAGLSTNGGGLLPEKRKQDNEQDDIKVKAIKDLANLCRDQAMMAHDAVSALVNLSDVLAVARHLVDPDFLVWAISYTANPTSPLSPLTAMLLSNLTSHPTLLPQIVNLKIPIIPLTKSKHFPPYYLPAALSATSTIHPDWRDPYITKPNYEAGQEEERTVEGLRGLVQAFEDGAAEGVKEGKGKRKGDVNFLASVFANVSMAPSTRHLLLTPRPPFPEPSSTLPSENDEPLLSKIVIYTEHSDLIRRGGALGCVKNCAMDRGSMSWLLASESDRVCLPSDPSRTVKGVDVLPWVLSPLMGAEEYDMEDMEKLPATLQFLPPTKQREKDPVLRMMCIEILLLLSTTYTGREALRHRGAYLVVRELHKVETDQSIKDAIERLVSLIQGEEGRETKREQLDHLVRSKGESQDTDELDVVEV